MNYNTNIQKLQAFQEYRIHLSHAAYLKDDAQEDYLDLIETLLASSDFPNVEQIDARVDVKEAPPRKIDNDQNVSDWYFCGTSFVNAETFRELTPAAFNIKFCHFETEGSETEKPVRIPGVTFLRNNYPDNIVESVEFRPGKPKVYESEDKTSMTPQVHLNSYRRKVFLPTTKIDDERFEKAWWRLMDCVFYGKETRMNFFTQFLAHSVQCPGQKKGYAIHVSSLPGLGKSVISTLMSGQVDTRIINNSDIQSQFNDYSQGNELKVIEEFRMPGSRRELAMENLKLLITNPILTITPKGKTGSQQHRSYCSVPTFSNAFDCLYIDENDRRWCAFVNKKSVKKGEALSLDEYAILHEFADNPDLHGSVNKFFKSVDISKFDTQKFISDNDNKEFVTESISEISSTIDELFMSGFLADNPDGFQCSAVSNALSMMVGVTSFTSHRIAKHLRSLGFQKMTNKAAVSVFYSSDVSKSYAERIAKIPGQPPTLTIVDESKPSPFSETEGVK